MRRLAKQVSLAQIGAALPPLLQFCPIHSMAVTEKHGSILSYSPRNAAVCTSSLTGW